MIPVAASVQAGPDWPPVVVASVFQTGLNLMRDLLRRGVRTVGIDCDQTHEGFRSSYGKSYLCPNPDTHPQEWVAFMIDLAQTLGQKPVIIPAADQFVSAIATHAEVLRQHFLFSMESVAVQGALATKEQQYALARQYGLPIPRSDYIQSRAEMEAFVSTARFPCLIKPRHQREWDVLPAGNPLRGRKLITSENATDMLAQYALTEPYRPEVMAQEIIAGGDDTKYCYLSVYGAGSRRLGHCVVQEFRAYPVLFGSGSLVAPVHDPEIAALCDKFLTAIGYVGICEIEVKRDVRDHVVRLIEANPRFSVTADAAIYMGVEIGWLNYLDLIGKSPAPMEPVRFDFRHIVLRRDLPCLPIYLQDGTLTWSDIRKSYSGPLEFFDFDLHDLGPTMTTLLGCLRVIFGTTLRWLGLKKPLPANH
jgi:predicted ATP-grasp superfamily ATP-dependent carboligase